MTTHFSADRPAKPTRSDRDPRAHETMRPDGIQAGDLPPNAMARVERLAYWLDERFRVPGTNMRVGLDGLVGLVPVVGDTATMLAALYVVYEARRLGAPASLIARMLVNVGLDSLVGTVPLVGDLFDMGFKANRRNLRLLRRHLERRQVEREGLPR
jgi:hypothetical protein